MKAGPTYLDIYSTPRQKVQKLYEVILLHKFLLQKSHYGNAKVVGAVGYRGGIEVAGE